MHPRIAGGIAASSEQIGNIAASVPNCASGIAAHAAEDMASAAYEMYLRARDHLAWRSRPQFASSESGQSSVKVASARCIA